MWQRLQSSISQPVDAATVIGAARDAAITTAADIAIREAQEAGGTGAAASKFATAYVQAAALNTAGGPQQEQRRAAAQQASRKSAEAASLSLLLVLPYCEVMCYVDLDAEALKASNQGSKGHR